MNLDLCDCGDLSGDTGDSGNSTTGPEAATKKVWDRYLRPWVEQARVLILGQPLPENRANLVPKPPPSPPPPTGLKVPELTQEV